MIVYRTPGRTVNPTDVVALADFSSRESARKFLIHFGELEAALADQFSPYADETSPDLDHLREISRLAAKAFLNWNDAPAVERLRMLLADLRLPDSPIRVRVPEGYAYYGLFPETYAESARRFYEAKWPGDVVCVGIRGIGASLSAVVGAALEQSGCRVYSWTVRPHGHPFDRRLDIEADLANAWRALSHAYFAIVDEGPGLSGSSFAAVAETISSLGIPDRRIVLFPSWTPSGEQFLSPRARLRWNNHEKYSTEPQSGGCIDISAGKWRSIFYGDASEYPDVQPQHEARKYLCGTSTGTALKKFAGLGLYGEIKLNHARKLAEHGFCPPVRGLEDGYLLTDFVPGQPLSASSSDPLLLETMARYLAFRYTELEAPEATPLDEITSMIEYNTGLRVAPPAQPSRPTLVDGRMLPHEWIATPTGYMKTDALDHGDNHFYPGPTDIAWDLAGAITEFDFAANEREFLLACYERLSGDRTIRSRLPFFTAAYLAFRVGYAAMNGFADQSERYRARLEKQQTASV